MENVCKRMVLLAGMMIVAGSALSQSATVPLTLENVVNAYIEKNLELQAARYRLDWTHADQIAAHLRPNPGFTFSAENLAFNGPTPTSQLYQLTATYSETIELGGRGSFEKSLPMPLHRPPRPNLPIRCGVESPG